MQKQNIVLVYRRANTAVRDRHELPVREPPERRSASEAGQIARMLQALRG